MDTENDLNENAAPIQCYPIPRVFGLPNIRLTTFMANRAVVLVPPIWTSLDPQMAYPIHILIKVLIFNNCGLDI